MIRRTWDSTGPSRDTFDEDADLAGLARDQRPEFFCCRLLARMRAEHWPGTFRPRSATTSRWSWRSAVWSLRALSRQVELFITSSNSVERWSGVNLSNAVRRQSRQQLRQLRQRRTALQYADLFKGRKCSSLLLPERSWS